MFDSAGTLGLECKLYSFSCRIQSVDFEFACRGQVSYLRCNGFKCHIVIFNDPVNLLVFYRETMITVWVSFPDDGGLIHHYYGHGNVVSEWEEFSKC